MIMIMYVLMQFCTYQTKSRIKTADMDGQQSLPWCMLSCANVPQTENTFFLAEHRVTHMTMTHKQID